MNNLSYARALFDLSIESNKSKEIYKEISIIKKSIVEKEFVFFLRDKTIDKDIKKNIFSSVFENEVKNKNVINFINIIIEKNDLNSLDKILNKYKKIFNDFYKIEEINLYSVISFTEEQKNNLVKKLKTILSVNEIYVNEFIDKSLIGGVRIESSNKV